MSNGEIVKYGARPKEPYEEGESSKFRDFLAWLLPWARKKGIRADQAADARLIKEVEEAEKVKAERLKLEAETRKLHVETTALVIEKEIQFKKDFYELMKQETEIGKAQKKNTQGIQENLIKEKLKELDDRREDLIKFLYLHGGEITSISSYSKADTKSNIQDE